MNDKIVKVIFKEGWETMYNSDLTQEDFGLVLQIEGITLPDGNVEVHFSLTEHNGEAPVHIGTVKDNVITVDIPDFILQKENEYNSSYEAYAWIYVTDGESGRTIRKIVFTIETRAKPTTNVPEDQKDQFLQEVRQVLTETKDIAQSVRDDADNGKFNGKDGDKGDAGKSAYEYAVEGGYQGTETEFMESLARAGDVITKSEHEEELLKAMVKVTTEEAEFHHLTDSANMKVVDFGMSGITEQDSVPGNQLFDISKFVSDLQATNNGDGSITLTKYAFDGSTNRISKVLPTVVAGQTIIISATTLSKLIYFGNTVKSFNSAFEVTQEMLDGGYFGFYGINGETTSDNPLTISDIMINEGTTALPIEEYVGGIPSPNSEHEEEIELAGVLNEETGRYEHKCCVGNKNLWDAEYASDINNWVESTLQTTYYDIPVYVGKGNAVTISYKDTLSTGLGMYVGVVIVENGTITNWLYHSTTNKHIVRSVIRNSVPNDYIWIRSHVSALKNGNFMTYIGNDLQIEISSVETDHIEHQGNTITLTSDRPLTKWDNLVKVDGKWYWDYKQMHLVFDGTNPDWVLYKSFNGFYTNKLVLPEKMNRRDGYCKQLRVDSVGIDMINGMWLGVNDGKTLYVIHNSFYDDTLEDYGLANWKAHLNENPLEIYTYSDTSELVPLPDEEQELLNNLETYYGVTNIYNEQGCPMWIKYAADQELHWNQKLLEIQQAII